MTDIYDEIRQFDEFYSNFRFMTKSDKLRRQAHVSRVLDLDGLKHALTQSAEFVATLCP